MFSRSKSFGHEIFALFVDTFVGGKCGIASNYKQKMEITKSGSTLTITSGCVCIRGRFLEEDTSTSISAGTDNAYCKLVVEIDLSKENTENELIQASYKILKGTNAYPTLTQTDIVANNSGVYQFELAQFRTTSSGIVDFVDKRTYLDFKSIYSEITQEWKEVLKELQTELENVKEGSIFVLQEDFQTLKKKCDESKKVLYNNSNGTNGTIILSESVDKFDYIEIFYKGQYEQHASRKIYNANGKVTTLIATAYLEAEAVLVTDYKSARINSTSITTNNFTVHYSTDNSFNKKNSIYIYRVDGYRY